MDTIARSYAVLGLDDPVAAVERIFASRYGSRVRYALLRVLEGEGYRLAARRAGLRDHKAVFDAAKCLELRNLHEQRKLERTAARYSKRDLAAVEAMLSGSPTTSQVIRAYLASSKRLEVLDAQ